MTPVHRYEATCEWEGSTAVGYESYRREHRVTAPPAEVALTLTSDPAYLGDPTHLNPEQLVVLAAASCQLLSFLAVAARARLDVIAYRDRAEGEMPEDDEPQRITTITLRPEITLRQGPSREKVAKLVGTAHRHCFIANSLRTDVVVEPTITFA